jgi:hypothetical protein
MKLSISYILVINYIVEAVIYIDIPDSQPTITTLVLIKGFIYPKYTV